jgi:hypothetical protein
MRDAALASDTIVVLWSRPLRGADDKKDKGRQEFMPVTTSSAIDSIIQLVRDEFGSVAELFKPIVIMDVRDCAEFKEARVAGVYVFLHDDDGCIKVGKHQENASKRALEHFRDNTSSKDKQIEMSKLRDSDKTHLLVFALQKKESMHWVLALEHFLEKTLSPRIPSERNG